MKKTLVLSAALALAGMSNAALAAEGGTAFVRAEVGHSEVQAGGLDDNDTAYSIRGGYLVNANFGFEGFYSSLYDAEIGNTDVSLTAIGVGIVAKKNFGADGKGFYIGGRAGLARYEGEVGSAEDSSSRGYAGVGVGYDFSESFGLSLNYDVNRPEFDGGDVDADTLTLAGEFRF